MTAVRQLILKVFSHFITLFYFYFYELCNKLDFNRARVQEWSRHHSISEVWKVPLRKFSAEKPVSFF